MPVPASDCRYFHRTVPTSQQTASEDGWRSGLALRASAPSQCYGRCSGERSRLLSKPTAIATPVAVLPLRFGSLKRFLGFPRDAYVCSCQVRPMPVVLYEHMFSSIPIFCATPSTSRLPFLTLEDGEEARREAEWEGRCPERSRRLSAPATSRAERRIGPVGLQPAGLSAAPAIGASPRVSAARVSPRAAHAWRSTCSARSRCKEQRSAATTH